MSDLDEKEQTHVRAALRFLQRRLGRWSAVSDAIGFSPKTIDGVVFNKKSVSASMALRVARLLGVMMDDLLVGKFLPPGACPNCGHVATPDFKDESTVVDAPRPAIGGGLMVVK
ncbi:hypothetical protein [Haliangium sp. UPWRP_2]|uniref:hypothetical protein n=1 Tax=Haliangium sp. UPWRP_2 TaxID=1931276 RepID=UPI000B541F0C|nr:hypothetical protein [Haliangium sp. UPWRP_2]PSM31671.1 hypothetical protein BVG81_004185 [Haliangium sp. UPWRP_2]